MGHGRGGTLTTVGALERPRGGVVGGSGVVPGSPRLTVLGEEGGEAYKIHGRHRKRDGQAYTFLSELRSWVYGGLFMMYGGRCVFMVGMVLGAS